MLYNIQYLTFAERNNIRQRIMIIICIYLLLYDMSKSIGNSTDQHTEKGKKIML